MKALFALSALVMMLTGAFAARCGGEKKETAVRAELPSDEMSEVAGFFGSGQ